jgi:FHA domain-containing protein
MRPMVVVILLLVAVGVGWLVWRRRSEGKPAAPSPLAGVVDQGRDLLAPFFPSKPLSRRALPRRLLRAAEGTVTVGVSGTVLVPTRIRIAVNPEDLEPFDDALSWLQRDLADALRQKAEANGWVVPAGPRVEIVADEERPVRLPRAAGRIDAFRRDDVATRLRTPGDLPAPPPPASREPVAPAPPAAPAPAEPALGPEPDPESAPLPEATAMTAMVAASLGPGHHPDLPTVADIVSLHVRLVSLAAPGEGPGDLNVLLVQSAPPLVLGRSREADLQVNDRQVSGRHCTLAVDPDRQVQVQDLGSTNGTYVDDERVEQALLPSGATLRLGRASWRVELDQVTGPPSPS